MDISPFANEKKRALLSKFVVTIASLLIILLIAGAVIFTAPQHISTIAYSKENGSYVYDAQSRDISELSAPYSSKISPDALFYTKNRSIYLKKDNSLIDKDLSSSRYSPDGTAILYTKYNVNSTYALIDGEKITITDYEVSGFFTDNRSLLLIKDKEAFIRTENDTMESMAKNVYFAKPLNIEGKYAFIYALDDLSSRDDGTRSVHIRIDGEDTLLGRYYNLSVNSTKDNYRVPLYADKSITNGIYTQNKDSKGIYLLLDAARFSSNLPNTLYYINNNGDIKLISNDVSTIPLTQYADDYVLYCSHKDTGMLHLYRDGKDYKIDTEADEVSFAKNGEYVIYVKGNTLFYRRLGSQKPQKITEVDFKGKYIQTQNIYSKVYPINNPQAIGDYIFYLDLSKYNVTCAVPANNIDLCMTTFGGQKQVIANNCNYYRVAQNRIYYSVTEKSADGYMYKTSVYSYKPGLIPEKRLLAESTSPIFIDQTEGDDAIIKMDDGDLYLSRSGGKPQLIDEDVLEIEYIE